MADTSLSESKFFHYVAMAGSVIIIGIMSWIGINVSHIPSIDQKLEDFIATANQTFSDHEIRIRALEHMK